MGRGSRAGSAPPQAFQQLLPTSQGSCSRMASPTLPFPGGISAGVQLLTPSAATTCKADQSGSETSAPRTSFECHIHGSQADLCIFFFLPNKPVGILNRAKEIGDEAQGQLKASKNQAQCIQQNLQPSCQIVCWSHQVVRAGETQTFTDFHQE